MTSPDRLRRAPRWLVSGWNDPVPPSRLGKGGYPYWVWMLGVVGMVSYIVYSAVK